MAKSSLADTLEAIKRSEVNAVVGAIASWAAARDDVRALALAGSWARGNPHQASDVDLLLFTDHNDWYRHRRNLLTEIDFQRAGYSLHASKNAVYGVVWSRHIHLLPSAEVELTFAKCSWARTEVIGPGTRRVVEDAFQIILDKDGMLARLVGVVMSG
jgi:predicted nucleotidyltransferase